MTMSIPDVASNFSAESHLNECIAWNMARKKYDQIVQKTNTTAETTHKTMQELNNAQKAIEGDWRWKISEYCQYKKNRWLVNVVDYLFRVCFSYNHATKKSEKDELCNQYNELCDTLQELQNVSEEFAPTPITHDMHILHALCGGPDKFAKLPKLELQYTILYAILRSKPQDDAIDSINEVIKDKVNGVIGKSVVILTIKGKDRADKQLIAIKYAHGTLSRPDVILIELQQDSNSWEVIDGRYFRLSGNKSSVNHPEELKRLGELLIDGKTTVPTDLGPRIYTLRK